MKLQQLTIHNIASIEEATIHFDRAPLSDSEVFLITGKTGSGKSTILDAICLALYANTPRLENTLMQGKTADGSKELTLKDPGQLLRRNTGEGWVRLTFVGLNGLAYEAEWSIARARKRSTGNLQSKCWTLRNLSSGHVLTKDREIEAEIKQAVGLDFSQFCRTTLLAQGEFTRFLNSRDDEKAEILEKITGVDVYSRMGAKIYALTQERKAEYDEAMRSIEHLSVLSDEEVVAMRSTLTRIEEQLHVQKTEREKLDAAYRWLKQGDELHSQLLKAELEFSEAKAFTQGEEFLREERIWTDWNRTIEARGWMAERLKAEETLANQQQALAHLRSDFDRLQSGLLWHAQELRRVQDEVRGIDAFLAEQTRRVPIYDQSQTVIALLRSRVEGASKIEERQKRIQEATKRLEGILRKQLKEAEEAYRKAKTDYCAQRDILTEAERKFAQMELPTLRNSKEEVQQRVNDLEMASQTLSVLKTEQARHAKAKGELEEMQLELKGLREQIEKQVLLLQERKVRRDTCQELMDKQQATVDQWAKTIRARLSEGDVCPVCQQRIASAFPEEELLDELFVAAEAAFQEADKLYQEEQKRQDQWQADFRSRTRLYESNSRRLQEDNSLALRTKEALEACRKCGIDELGETTERTLASRQKALREDAARLVSAIQQAEKQEDAVKSARSRLDDLRQVGEKARDLLLACERQVDQAKGQIEADRQWLDSMEKELGEAGDKICELVPDLGWTQDWRSAPNEFIHELSEATAYYHKQNQRRQALALSLSEGTTSFQHAQEVQRAVHDLMPAWVLPAELQPKEQQALLPALQDLLAQVRSCQDQSLAADTRRKEALGWLASYQEENPDLSEKYLSDLSAYTSDTISPLQARLQQGKNRVIDKQSALQLLKSQQEEHLRKQPAEMNEVPQEELQERIVGLDQQLGLLGDQRATTLLLLQQDEQKKQERGKIMAEAERKKSLYERWARVNQLLGDASGSKFRKIAQSYVLASLIQAANQYMRMLTNRYTLKVAPGTFVILLEDAYQGFASRAASTISGGESFLVSLSLALALSDIGQRLSVDTLFIDEGFGTLSGEPLQQAIQTLRSLHARAGRHVGIISHVEELRERIPVQIQVTQEGNNSSSRVEVVSL